MKFEKADPVPQFQDVVITLSHEEVRELLIQLRIVKRRISGLPPILNDFVLKLDSMLSGEEGLEL